jgi:ribosomal subunit interface protein
VDIVFKGRHTTVQERFRQQATVKLAKLEKLLRKVIRIDVEVSKERNPRHHGWHERVELTIRSRGPAIRAEAAADDRFAALDLALGKLESRLRRAGERRKERHCGHGTFRASATANGSAAAGRQAAAEPAVAADDWSGQVSARPDAGESTGSADTVSIEADDTVSIEADDTVPIEMEGDGPLVVRQKVHAAAPMTIDQALFEMELVGHDFYLFRDKDSGCPSVVYRRCGYRYGVIRLVETKVPAQSERLAAS